MNKMFSRGIFVFIRGAMSKKLFAVLLSLILLSTVILPVFDALFSTSTTQIVRPELAAATPTLESRRAEVRAVAAEVAELDRRLDIASDDYHEAREAYEEATERREEADERLERTQNRLDTVQLHLNTRAVEVYRSQSVSGGILEVLLGATSFEEFAGLWTLLDDLNRSDAANSAELKDLRTEINSLREELLDIEEEAKKQSERMREARERAETDLANRQEVLRGLEAEVAELQRQQEEAARRAAEALAAAQALAAAGRNSGNNNSSSANNNNSGGGSQSFPAPTNQPRSEVLNIGRRYLGTPYLWGGTTPSGFDCSGFTQYVFRQVGVNLPRTSREQIHAGQRVNRGDMRAGDLVFFGNPIHHVGIYAGGGQMIHSPTHGQGVTFTSISVMSFAGAARP